MQTLILFKKKELLLGAECNVVRALCPHFFTTNYYIKPNKTLFVIIIVANDCNNLTKLDIYHYITT